MLYGFDNPLDKWVGALAAVYRSGSSDEREEARRFLVVNRDDTPGGVVVNVSIRTGRALGVTFEEGAGFHATRFTLADSKGDPAIMQTLNFDRIDGIYVPRRIERTTYRGSSDLLSRRVMELKSCYFNRPIQANAFTWTALDLKTGDRIYNKAAKELSVVQDGVLVSPADYRGEQDTLVEKGESVRHWRLFVVAAAIVCGVIAVALIGSKSRRLRMR
jgi:hypothetical protein